MKKNKIAGLLALMSCATLVTGCSLDDLAFWKYFTKEEQKEEVPDTPDTPDTPETPEEEPKVMPKVEVSIDVTELPSELLVGDQLDLEEYVSVYGTNTPYSVSIAEESASLASVDGHVISVNGEGTVNFTISAGTKSFEGSFGAIDELRRDFREFSKPIENDYVVYHLDLDLDSERVSIGGEMKHTDKYVYDDYFSSNEDGEYLGGGFIEIDEEIYSYVMNPVEVPAEEEEGEPSIEYVPSFKIYGDEPASIASISGSFGLKSDDFEVLRGTEEESVGFFTDSALFLPASKENFNKVNTILLGTSDISNYGYSFAGAYIEEFGTMTFVDEETGARDERLVFTIVPTYTSSSDPDPSPFLDLLFVVVQDSETNVEVLDEYIASAQIPQGLSFSLYESVLNSFASQSSFTLDTLYGSYFNDERLSAAAAAYYGEMLGLPFDDATGEVKAYVSPNQIHTEEVGLEHLSFGYVVGEDSKVYSYSFVADEVEPVEVTEPAADVEGGFPAHAIYEMYLANGIEAQIPVYSAAAPAEFELYDMAETHSEIYVNSTSEEYFAYLNQLVAAGWSIISEYDEETVDFTLRFADTTATCQLIDYIDYYGQYLVYFSYDSSLTNGHYVAVETEYESLSDLGAQDNYSFLKSSVKVVNPITSQLTTAYESIYVNDVSASAQQIDFGTEEAPDLHTIVTRTASFAGKTGMTLLLYLAYFSTPVSSPSDRYCLGDVIYSLMRAGGYLDEAEMSVSVVYDYATYDIYGVEISFRVLWGQVAQGINAYWGFDTTFKAASMPEIDIEFPVQEVELP